MAENAHRRTTLLGVIAFVTLSTGVAGPAPAAAAPLVPLVPLTSHDPSGGLVVSLEPGPSRSAVVRVLPLASFASLRVDLTASDGARWSGSASSVVGDPDVGREITR